MSEQNYAWSNFLGTDLRDGGGRVTLCRPLDDLERLPVNEDALIVAEFANDIRRLLCHRELTGAHEHADCCKSSRHRVTSPMMTSPPSNQLFGTVTPPRCCRPEDQI